MIRVHDTEPMPATPRRQAPLHRRATAVACALALALANLATPALAQSASYANPIFPPPPAAPIDSALPAPPSASRLPALGDSDSAEFTVGIERKLGDEIMREIRVDPDYVDDPLLLEYLQAVWQPLVTASRALGNITPDIDERFAWQPFLVRDPSVNAFALPGGFVGVHLGLIAITSSRDELASVLGHEMSHVTQRHIARSITANSRRSLVNLAALVLGLLAASRATSPDAMNAVLAGSQALAIQGQLNFSRDVEREADRVGFQVMTAAGYVPSGMADMFQKMDVSSRLNDFGGYPYLRSHPLTVERIGEARARAGIVSAAPRISVLEHTIAQARASVLMDTRVDALRRWQARDADTERLGGRPGARRLRERAGFEPAARLQARRPGLRACALAVVRGSPNSSARAERAVVLMQGQSLLDRREAARAREAIKAYATDGTRPVLLLETQIALIETPNVSPDNAALRAQAGDLQTWAAVHSDDPLVWNGLAQTWSRLGQPLRSLRAEAEWRFALGDLRGAIDRLRAGQRMARSGVASGDFIDASVLDSRLRDIDEPTPAD